eukprot:2203481-Amphidinium_carterae.1
MILVSTAFRSESFNSHSPVDIFSQGPARGQIGDLELSLRLCSWVSPRVSLSGGSLVAGHVLVLADLASPQRPSSRHQDTTCQNRCRTRLPRPMPMVPALSTGTSKHQTITAATTASLLHVGAHYTSTTHHRHRSPCQAHAQLQSISGLSKTAANLGNFRPPTYIFQPLVVVVLSRESTQIPRATFEYLANGGQPRPHIAALWSLRAACANCYPRRLKSVARRTSCSAVANLDLPGLEAYLCSLICFSLRTPLTLQHSGYGIACGEEQGTSSSLRK